MAYLSENKYRNFTEKDFIDDPFFQDWVVNPDVEKNAFWFEFLAMCPEKRPELEHARMLFQTLAFKEDFPDDDFMHQSFIEHLEDVKKQDGTYRWRVSRGIIRRLAAVAALTGAVIISYITLHSGRGNGRNSIATKYGEIKRVVLADSTVIILNAHSEVHFDGHWGKNSPREVWLKGEAYFKVKHLNTGKAVEPGDRFVVHGENFAIDVLGTVFDIRQRRGKTEVVLESGEIRLIPVNISSKEIKMKPGEIVTYNSLDNKLTLNNTVPENYSGWKEKKLILNNPTLGEITNYLEDNYGKRIVVVNSEMIKKKIEGPIILNNLDDALFIMSTVLNMDVEKKDSAIMLRKR